MKRGRFIVAAIMILAALSIGACASTATNPLANVAGLNLQTARDATKSLVDALCPEPKVQDPRGSFEAGFFDRYMKNRQAVELSQQDAADIEAFKLVCAKPLPDRTDYDYGTLAGGAIDRVMIMLTPYLGRDVYNLMAILGLVIK